MRFAKIAYLKLSLEDNMEATDENIICHARLVAACSNRGSYKDTTEGKLIRFNNKLGETLFYIQIFNDIDILWQIFGLSSVNKDEVRKFLREHRVFQYKKDTKDVKGKSKKWVNSLFNIIPKSAILYGHFHMDQIQKSRSEFFFI